MAKQLLFSEHGGGGNIGESIIVAVSQTDDTGSAYAAITLPKSFLPSNKIQTTFNRTPASNEQGFRIRLMLGETEAYNVTGGYVKANDEYDFSNVGVAWDSIQFTISAKQRQSDLAITVTFI